MKFFEFHGGDMRKKRRCTVIVSPKVHARLRKLQLQLSRENKKELIMNQVVDYLITVVEHQLKVKV